MNELMVQKPFAWNRKRSGKFDSFDPGIDFIWEECVFVIIIVVISNSSSGVMT